MSILVIHGGAGTISTTQQAQYEDGLKTALKAGYEALTAQPGTADSGGESRALAAVLEAVTAMESNPSAFNAGIGGALTRDGVAELDACVMVSGAAPGKRAGAVACVTNTPNPVLLANLVRKSTPHVMLIGAGAEEFVEVAVANEALITAGSRASLDRWLAGDPDNREQAAVRQPTGSNTVGAVALDDHGNLAAATSTGGRTGQWQGRVGDAPIPGLGTWADEQVAISCTGVGEAFMEARAAGQLADALAAGATLEAAVKRVLNAVADMDGDGGIIALTTDGRLAVGFNSPDMAYGIATGEGLDSEVARTPFVKVIDPA